MPEDEAPPQPHASLVEDEADFAPRQPSGDVNEHDMRNAVLLVDAKRREFLADLDPLTVNSYAVLYARAEKWSRYAHREHLAAKKRGDADAEKWSRLEERWSIAQRWLDRNLTMSGSIRGRRAEQLVDVLSGSRDQPSVGGTQVVVPQLYQPPAASSKKKPIWSR